MFCSKCGKQIPDGGSFCQRCGKPVNTAYTPPMPQAEQSADVPQSMQSADTAQPMPRVFGRPTAPLPAELPIECPVCGMLAYPGRSHCLICDADLGAAVPPERGAGRESRQASAPEQTSDQESEDIAQMI